MRNPRRKNGDLLPSCAVNHNSVHIASNTKLMIANCQSASVLQEPIRNCEAAVHKMQERHVCEVTIFPVRRLRIIDFVGSSFVQRINHPAGNNGPHPTGPPPRWQLAVSFSQAMLWGPQLHIFREYEQTLPKAAHQPITVLAAVLQLQILLRTQK